MQKLLTLALAGGVATFNSINPRPALAACAGLTCGVSGRETRYMERGCAAELFRALKG